MRVEDVEDIYPLSPMQEGLLYHALESPGTQAYVDQVAITFEGDLDIGAFRAAWQNAVDRHAMLRAGFVWQRLDRPRHVVHRRATFPLTILDWSEADGDRQEADLQALVEQDRNTPFDLADPPLLRCHLVRLAPERYRCVCSAHHLILDGFSTALVLADVGRAYAKLVGGDEPERRPSPPFRDYIGWLGAQDEEKAASFWRGHLSGLARPHSLRRGAEEESPHTAREWRTSEAVLDEESAREVTEGARRNRLTLGTLVQGAWALLLARYSGNGDVVFGSVSSGRPTDLAGAEETVGTLADMFPIRIRVRPDTPVIKWLEEIQTEAVAARQFGHFSLPRIQEWGPLPRGLPLFDTILALENFAGDLDSLWSGLEGITASSAESFGPTNYPLAVGVFPEGGRVRIRVDHDPGWLPVETAERIAADMAHTVARLLDDPQGPVRGVSSFPATLTSGDGGGDREHVPSERGAGAPEPVEHARLRARVHGRYAQLGDAGVRSGSVVAVATGEPSERAVDVLAALAAGATVVPLVDDGSQVSTVSGWHGPAYLVTDGASPGESSHWRGVLAEPAPELPSGAVLGPRTLPETPALILDGGGGGRPAHLVSGRSVAHLYEALTALCVDEDPAPVEYRAARGTAAEVVELALTCANGVVSMPVDSSMREDGPSGARAWSVTEEDDPSLPDEERFLVLSLGGRVRALLHPGSLSPLPVVDRGPGGWRIDTRSTPVTVEVLDVFGDPLPAGVPGELQVGGRGWGHGHLGRGLLTADENRRRPDGRVLTPTGRLARYTRDGELWLLGTGSLGDPALPAAPAPAPDEYVPPRTELERLVASVWEELLDVRQVGATSSFAQLGGDSLAAVRTATMLERRLDREVDLADVLDSATVSELAARLDSTGSPTHALALRASGDRPPLLLIHPNAGNPRLYQPLMERLGEDQPCHMLEHRDLNDCDSVDDLAELLLPAAREVAGDGPFRVAGLSFGGLTALEVARRLAEEGGDVQLVAMFDTTLPRPLPPDTPDHVRAAVDRTRALALAAVIERVLHSGPIRVTEAELVGLDGQAQWDLVFTRAQEAGAFGGGSEQTMRRLLEGFKAPSRLTSGYVPKTYDGDVVLYRAMDPPPEHLRDPVFNSPRQDGGWGEHLPSLNVQPFPGDHLSLLTEPHVGAVAAHLSAALGSLNSQGARP